ncbi:MAG: hypothetical protein PVH95_13355 [Anaerolineae bacterium]|jgi:hypothetical protein
MKTDIGTATLWGDLRIIWAIMAKDVLDAVKSKTTLSILLSVLFVLVIYQVLPEWERGSDLPVVLVYDVGASDLLPALKRSPNLDVYTGYTSQDQLERKLVAGDIPELAVTLPLAFDQSLASPSPSRAMCNTGSARWTRPGSGPWLRRRWRGWLASR